MGGGGVMWGRTWPPPELLEDVGWPPPPKSWRIWGRIEGYGAAPHLPQSWRMWGRAGGCGAALQSCWRMRGRIGRCGAAAPAPELYDVGQNERIWGSPTPTAELYDVGQNERIWGSPPLPKAGGCGAAPRAAGGGEAELADVGQPPPPHPRAVRCGAELLEDVRQNGRIWGSPPLPRAGGYGAAPRAVGGCGAEWEDLGQPPAPRAAGCGADCSPAALLQRPSRH